MGYFGGCWLVRSCGGGIVGFGGVWLRKLRSEEGNERLLFRWELKGGKVWEGGLK